MCCSSNLENLSCTFKKMWVIKEMLNKNIYNKKWKESRLNGYFTLLNIANN